MGPASFVGRGMMPPIVAPPDLGQHGIPISPGRVKEIDAMSVPGQAITLVVDHGDTVVTATPVQWAIARLEDALAAAGVPVQTSDRVADSRSRLTMLVAGPSAPSVRAALVAAGVELPNAAEALALVPTTFAGRAVTLATGADARG